MVIHISGKNEFMERLKAEATKAGMSVSEYIRYCVIRHWETQKGRE